MTVMTNRINIHPFLRPVAAWLLAGLLVIGCTQKQSDLADGKGADSTADSTQHRDSVTVLLVGKDSVSVFDLLRSAHTVEYKSTAMGVFVLGIDSVMNCDEAYWIYAVNDTMPKTASDKLVTRTGDRVVWHLRKTGR